MFDLSSIDLPIVDILEEVKSQLATDATLIVHAPPGAGKKYTPAFGDLRRGLAEGTEDHHAGNQDAWQQGLFAMRMAELLGEKVGETVGYRIRFETKVSDKTKIEVVTEGILTRMLHGDNSLEGIGLVIFDEFPRT